MFQSQVQNVAQAADLENADAELKGSGIWIFSAILSFKMHSFVIGRRTWECNTII